MVLLAVPATTTGFAGPVTVNGGPGNDVIDGSAVTAANAPSLVLNGDEGHDTLTGGVAADAINGGSGDDLLAGGPGNNTLGGGTGFDTVLVAGTLASDRIDVNQSAAATLVTTVNGNVRTDTLVLAAGTPTVEAVRVEGLAGDDIIHVAWADSLGVDATANSLRMDVHGGPAGTRDRLAVVDGGTRRSAAVPQGRVGQRGLDHDRAGQRRAAGDDVRRHRIRPAARGGGRHGGGVQARSLRVQRRAGNGRAPGRERHDQRRSHDRSRCGRGLRLCPATRTGIGSRRK